MYLSTITNPSEILAYYRNKPALTIPGLEDTARMKINTNPLPHKPH